MLVVTSIIGSLVHERECSCKILRMQRCLPTKCKGSQLQLSFLRLHCQAGRFWLFKDEYSYLFRCNNKENFENKRVWALGTSRVSLIVAKVMVSVQRFDLLQKLESGYQKNNQYLLKRNRSQRRIQSFFRVDQYTHWTHECATKVSVGQRKFQKLCLQIPWNALPGSVCSFSLFLCKIL